MTSINADISGVTNVWLDSHVHVYDTVDVDLLLNSALANFTKISTVSALGSNEFVLIVTEGENEGAADRLRDASSQRWALEPADDPRLLIARSKNAGAPSGELGERLLIILGQQLITSEGIEVLVVGVERQDYAPRKTLDTLLSSLSHGVVILPWGVGKWLGARGASVSEVLNHHAKDLSLYVGDIPARKSLFGGGTQLKLADKLAIPTLRGTDNLPLKGDEVRVGQFGTRLAMPETRFKESPVTSLLQCLDPNLTNENINQFGDFMSFLAVVKSQIQLRL